MKNKDGYIKTDALSNAEITDDHFNKILMKLMDKNPASHLLGIPGIYEIVSEKFNNDVLEFWENEG